MTFKNDLFYFTSRVKDPEILNFHKSGYTKIDISLKDEISELKDRFFF